MLGKRTDGTVGDSGRAGQAAVSPGRPRGLWSGVLAAGIIVVVISAVYMSSFSGVFLFDDRPFVEDNQRIRQLWPIGECLGGRRPVVSLSLAINYAIGGLDPWGYHVFNLLVHLLAALALFGVVRRTLLLAPFEGVDARRARWLALVVALVWGVHPLATQSVTYIIQRGESLMGLFYLLTLYCVIRGSGSRRAWWWYAAAISSCALGMGSKAVMVTAPLMVALYDRVVLSGSFAVMLRRRWGLYVGLGVTWGLLVTTGVVRGVLFPPETAAGTVGFSCPYVTPLEYLRSQPGVILHYLKVSIWPRVLCLDYGWPVAVRAGEIVPQSLVVVLLVAAAAWAFRARPWLGLAGAWFFLILAPTSSFVPIRDLAFEHRMYLPLASVVGVGVIGGHWLLRLAFDRWQLGPVLQPVLLGVVVAIAVCPLGYRTFQRSKDYHSELAMWRDVVGNRPENPRGHCNLSKALVDVGEFDRAMAHARKALALQPEYAEPYNNLGAALKALGRLDEAVTSFRQGLQVKPDSADTHYNLGTVLRLQENSDEAVGHLREAVRIKPHLAEAHNNLGLILKSQGRLEEAIGHYRQAVSLKPYLAEAHHNLGLALAERGDVEAAIGRFERALRIKPDFAEAHNSLGIALKSQGRVDNAIEQFRRALQVEPSFAEAHANLGFAFESQGKAGEAIQHYREALRLKPDIAAVHNSLGLALAKSGHLGEAVGHFEEALRIEPVFAKACVNLGNARRLQGRFSEAIHHYGQALQFEPGYAEARFNLGTALMIAGRSDEALAQFQETNRQRPDWPAPLQRMAWILATSPDADARNATDAIRLAERAAELTQYGDAQALDALAAAHAAAGQFDKAVATAERALALASAAHVEVLAGAIRARLELYRQGIPYTEAAPSSNTDRP